MLGVELLTESAATAESRPAHACLLQMFPCCAPDAVEPAGPATGKTPQEPPAASETQMPDRAAAPVARVSLPK
jgi:hypothetical protein